MFKALLAIPLVFSALPTFAQEVEGAEAYRMICASCHGESAMGEGPLADLLRVPVPDLRGLAARNEGVFPTEHVVRQIDGRDMMRAHGSPMPAFGGYFDTGERSMALKTEDGMPILTSPGVVAVIEYLMSIQE